MTDVYKHFGVPDWVCIGAQAMRHNDEYYDIVTGFKVDRDSICVNVLYPDGGTVSSLELKEFLKFYTPMFNSDGTQMIDDIPNYMRNKI